ncbi:YjbH domain-containing protein [Ideonella paludis]|uniref:YjbH domain-containing protein n=1 Tax=Ideonella paludis TaxID=1233411 RepID=UPI00362BFA39
MAGQPPCPPASPSAARSTAGPSADTLQALALQTGWPVARAWQDGATWVVELDNSQGNSLDERLDRGVAVLHERAPDEVQQFQFILMQQGVAVSSRSVARQAWAAPRWSWTGHAPVLDSTPESVQRPAPDSAEAHRPARQGNGGFSLGYQQHVGGPDGYLYALSARAQGQLPLWEGAWAQGTLQARLLDNYERYRYTAPSALPRVRTLVREYLTQARVTLPYAQLSQLNRWGEDVFSLAYVGALEPMFAGAGAEVLWRPQGGRWALGLDVNRVAQREFDQRWDVRDYRVTTGHVSAYWDTGWQGLEAKVSVGQYLAGDRGATMEVSRRFANGARIGAWVTKTNVSSAAFGEGSFDKAVYVSIPFDAFLSAWSTQTLSVAWQPLIRDGGARLNKLHTLWNLTGSRDPRAWRQAE